MDEIEKIEMNDEIEIEEGTPVEEAKTPAEDIETADEAAETPEEVSETVDEESADEKMLPKKKRSFKEVIRSIPIVSRVFFCIFFAALVIHILSFVSEGFANFFNENISAFFRMILAKLTGWIPVSLAETAVIALPFALILIFVYFFGVAMKKDRAGRFVVVLLSVVTMLYSTFVITFGTGYQNSSLDVKLGIERRLVSPEDLYQTALKVNDEIAGVIDDIPFPAEEEASSDMPYGLDEMISRLNDAYDKLIEKYDFIPRLHSRVKYIALSKPMTYTHVSGVYCYYTGEANINVNFPDYTVVYTAAHEMAHQRGICPEDEANFVAFLVCIESDDPYIRYSGYQNMLEYLMNALYSADRELYSQLYSEIEGRSRAEMRAYNLFFEPYRKSVASKVSSAVNDTYLKVLGEKAGEKSYGMVVDLAVAYYGGAE